MDTVQDAIAHIPQLAGLDAPQQTQIAEAASLARYLAGDTVLDMRRDGLPKGFTFLVEGDWTMARYIKGLEEPVIWHDQRQGSWHGGIDFIDTVAPAHVVAEKDSVVLFVPAVCFLKLAEESQSLAHSMLRGVQGGATLLWNAADG